MHEIAFAYPFVRTSVRLDCCRPMAALPQGAETGFARVAALGEGLEQSGGSFELHATSPRLPGAAFSHLKRAVLASVTGLTILA
jgi:hypothetical protein